MIDFTLHTVDSAPVGSKPLLEKSQREYGMIPNLHAVMAESPAVLEAYQTLHELFAKGSSLSAEEQSVVWLAISVENGCHYCVPAHTGIAKSTRVREEVIEALRDERPLPDDRLEALRRFTVQTVRNRGDVSQDDVESFIAAGFDKRQLLEVILGVSQKVMSNYINAIAETPVDAPFEPYAWRRTAG